MDKPSSSYLLIVRDTTPEVYEDLSPSETRDRLDRWNAWVDRMGSAGKLQDGRPLADDVRTVVGREARVVDGPFAEAKELVGGYFLLMDLSLDEATAIARECPLLADGMTVEIRPVASACHLALALGWETMRERSTT